MSTEVREKQVRIVSSFRIAGKQVPYWVRILPLKEGKANYFANFTEPYGKKKRNLPYCYEIKNQQDKIAVTRQSLHTINGMFRIFPSTFMGWSWSEDRMTPDRKMLTAEAPVEVASGRRRWTVTQL